MGTCPDCEENFELEEYAEPVDVTECPKCSIRLEILNTQPVMLDYAAEEDLSN